MVKSDIRGGGNRNPNGITRTLPQRGKIYSYRGKIEARQEGNRVIYEVLDKRGMPLIQPDLAACGRGTDVTVTISINERAWGMTEETGQCQTCQLPLVRRVLNGREHINHDLRGYGAIGDARYEQAKAEALERHAAEGARALIGAELLDLTTDPPTVIRQVSVEVVDHETIRVYDQ